jgi:ribosomal protein S18 acetylase RimI-like enzyme
MIRKAIFEDATAIARIHVGTWRTAYAGIVPDDYLASLSEEQRTKSWQRHLTDGRTIIWVAEKDGQVIGWVAGGASRDADAQGDSEVYAIYVSSQHWACGVGRELMAKMEDSFPDGQSTTLWVLRDNQRAIRFYEKVGYRPDGAQKEIQLGGRGFCEIRFQKSRPNKTVEPTRAVSGTRGTP